MLTNKQTSEIFALQQKAMDAIRGVIPSSDYDLLNRAVVLSYYRQNSKLNDKEKENALNGDLYQAVVGYARRKKISRMFAKDEVRRYMEGQYMPIRMLDFVPMYYDKNSEFWAKGLV